ncbi:ARM repeat-containing protein [Amylocystis lapponica]|nr:ARM repeat-containing protein [Amylocystis lapponica]
MDQDLSQFVQAILIASDPSQGALHQQALEYISTVQQNSTNTWRLALALFVETGSNGARKYPPQARFFALRVLDDFLDNRFETLDEESFQTLQQSLVAYIRSEYLYGSAEAEAAFLRNKFAHTLTLFFLCTYVDQWPSFFTDFFTLIRPPESTSQSTYNEHVSLLFFHLILEISGEVADQMIKAARSYNHLRQARDTRVRDAMRERDAGRINEAVLTIVADCVERMLRLRKIGAPSSERELDSAVEVVDWGIRTFASYVGWIDINLTVTPITIPLLFSLLSDPSLAIRLATSAALLRIVSKGLKEPADKLQLIKVLSLAQVLDALEEKTRAEQASRGSDIDEGEESYREALGKLLNVLGLELCKLVDECPNSDVRSDASQLLHQTLPVMLHFMADEYDDTCSTVFPMLQTILASYKRMRKTSSEPLDDTKRSFLTSLLSVILDKLKWDEDSDPDDMDEDDKAAFEELRKDLRTFMDSTLVIDQALVTDALRTLAINTLTAYQNGAAIKWNDAELAVYVCYIFGEINKSGGKGRAAFCQTPPAPKVPAALREKRRDIDYSEFPLTSHGEMLYALVQSGISSYPHKTVVMQFFETASRYGDFFKIRKECIMPTLQAMMDTRGLHNSEASMCSRVFYLYHRFIREDRNEIPADIAVSLLEGMRDLLVVQVELPELENPDQQDLLTEAVANPGIFDSQLYLFETAGTLISLTYKTPDRSAALLLTIVKPLLDELSGSLQAVKGADDVLPIVKVHHDIMALGNIAKGFPDYPSPVPDGYISPPLDVFNEVAQSILVSLEAMNVFKVVRDATRFAFARILATTGPNVARLIPSLMANLLAHFEPTELVDFMSFIGLLTYKLQDDMFDVLDQLIGPLSTHINGILSQPVTGTDEQLAHVDTKKAYLALLNNIVASKLHRVLISERNGAQLENLLASMQRLAEDVSDPQSQKAAFTFLGRCVIVWAQPLPDGNSQVDSQGLPGFERFIYERLIPTAFAVFSSPQFNLKDGQMVVVLHEICNFLQSVSATRGQEAFDFFVSIFLPAQNWPPDAALEFSTKLKTLDGKAFRKYFSDFVRATRAGS